MTGAPAAPAVKAAVLQASRELGFPIAAWPLGETLFDVLVREYFGNQRSTAAEHACVAVVVGAATILSDARAKSLLA